MISLKQNLNEKLAGIEEQIRSQKQYILSEKSKLSEIDASKLSQLETLYEEAANSKNELEKEYIRAQQRMAKTKEKFARRLLNKQNEIAQTETELREKEVYLQQKQAYLSLKQMHSAGLSSKQGAKAEAVKDIMSASGDVGTVISACKCAEGEDSWLSGTGCKKACAFDDDYNVGSDEKSCGKKRSSPRRSTGGAKKTS